MHFLAFWISASSVSIAVLFSENSGPVKWTLLDSLLPGSFAPNPTPGNEYPTLSGSSSLNPTTPGNDPSPINVDQNIVQLETLGDIHTFSPEIAQGPSTNGAEESSIISPPITNTEAQTHPENSNVICNLRSRNGPERRKRELLCRPRGLIRDERGRTEKEKKKDALSDADMDWIWKKLGSEAWKLSDWELINKLLEMNEPGKEACQSQRREEGVFVRHNSLCCLGPEEIMTGPTEPTWPILGNRLVRRQEEIPVNVRGCELFIEGRPFCARKQQRYCCGSTDVLDIDDWGYKGLDCVHMLWNPDEIQT